MLIRLLPNVIIGDGLLAFYDPGGPVLKLWFHGYLPDPYRGDQAVEAWDALGRRVAPEPGATTAILDVVAGHGRRLDMLEHAVEKLAELTDGIASMEATAKDHGRRIAGSEKKVHTLTERARHLENWRQHRDRERADPAALAVRMDRLEARETAEPAPAARVIRVPAIGQRVVCDGGREGVVCEISLGSPCHDDGVTLSVRMDDFGIRSDWSWSLVRLAGPYPRFVEIAIRDAPSADTEPGGAADRVDVAGPADVHHHKAGGPSR